MGKSRAALAVFHGCPVGPATALWKGDARGCSTAGGTVPRGTLLFLILCYSHLFVLCTSLVFMLRHNTYFAGLSLEEA